MALFDKRLRVSFGDCDPAGIVFYPNIFAWLDRTFHAYLYETADGHAAICSALGARGIGLVNAECGFISPVTEGDELTVTIPSIEWDKRTFCVAYIGQVDGRKAFEGREIRALFIQQDGRIRSGDLTALRNRLSQQNRPETSLAHSAAP